MPLRALAAFAVAQRTHEIGVRVALGAQTRDVVLLIAAEGARTPLAGARDRRGRRLDPATLDRINAVRRGARRSLTFGGVLLVLGIVSLLAAYLPARRAARIEPMSALRAE